MIFQWLGLMGDEINTIRILCSVFSGVALVAMLVFFILYLKHIKESIRIARGYVRVSALSGVAMGIFGLFGVGTMWYLDLLIIAINAFTYNNNRE